MANFIANKVGDPLTVTASSSGVANSDAIDMREYAGAHVETPTSLGGATTITWYHSNTRDGTYKALRDSSNAAVTQPMTANASLAVHAACNACYFIKATVDSADVQLVVTRKSGG